MRWSFCTSLSADSSPISTPSIHQINFADDAFYYFVVAQHIVRDGKSTFDGFTLTNGYHPLWMALLILQYKLLGQSLLLTRCIEFLLGEAALILTLLFVRLPNLSQYPLHYRVLLRSEPSLL